jgi:hypothetical protein
MYYPLTKEDKNTKVLKHKNILEFLLEMSNPFCFPATAI